MSFVNLEIAIVVGRHIFVGLDILLDDLIGHVPGTHGKVTPCPHVPPPILPFQLAKFLLQAPTTATFQPGQVANELFACIESACLSKQQDSITVEAILSLTVEQSPQLHLSS